MAQATVKTVQFLDPRIEPQPDPVYDYVIGPIQQQYYQIPASGKSDASITFNNLTTLGADRAYLDTFEVELEVEITFTLNDDLAATDGRMRTNGTSAGSVYRLTGETVAGNTTGEIYPIFPDSRYWTMESWPMNKCCEQCLVNINGGAFNSEPMLYVRAKERYMNQTKLAQSYENICPYSKPILQNESGQIYSKALSSSDYLSNTFDTQHGAVYTNSASLLGNYGPYPNRTSLSRFGAICDPRLGYDGGYNNSIIKLGAPVKPYPEGDFIVTGYDNYRTYWKRIPNTTLLQPKKTVVAVKWREPIFCTPFSSRYDATYGRPLYNITSMDITLNFQSLNNMIRTFNIYPGAINGTSLTDDGKLDGFWFKSVDVHIVNTPQLCYQVLTIPNTITKPLTTIVPYRRFVPYITEITGAINKGGVLPEVMGGEGLVTHKATSGVYTLNQIPTAIWIFVGPSKYDLQSGVSDKYSGADIDAAGQVGTVNTGFAKTYDTNLLFAYIKRLNLSMANTTQILNTAKPEDLYRIAKANGCFDSYWSWYSSFNSVTEGGTNGTSWKSAAIAVNDVNYAQRTPLLTSRRFGAGSVLRLRPGVDIILPDQPLIPGANGRNIVFQIQECEFYAPPRSFDKYSLYILFEYVGVAAISPGQCEITMNPLGTGEVINVSPVMSATSDETEGELGAGSGFFDKTQRGAEIAAQIADTGVISKILKAIPQTKEVGEYLEKHGFGEPGCKRSRGGAVLGKGIEEWV